MQIYVKISEAFFQKNAKPFKKRKIYAQKKKNLHHVVMALCGLYLIDSQYNTTFHVPQKGGTWKVVYC